MLNTSNTLTIKCLKHNIAAATDELTLINPKATQLLDAACVILFSDANKPDDIARLQPIVAEIEPLFVFGVNRISDLISEILFNKLAAYLIDITLQPLSYRIFSNVYGFYNLLKVTKEARYVSLTKELMLLASATKLGSDFDGDMVMPSMEYANRRQGLFRSRENMSAIWATGDTIYNYDADSVFKYFTVSSFERIAIYISAGIVGFANIREQRTR